MKKVKLLINLVVVIRMAKTSAKKMKEWRENQRLKVLKGRQASQRYYETHKAAKTPSDVTDGMGDLARNFLKIYFVTNNKLTSFFAIIVLEFITCTTLHVP